LEAVGDVSGSLASQILKATSTSWQFISLRFTTGASDSTTTVKIYLSGQNGNATAYVDLVSLKKADTAYTYDYSPYGNDGTIVGPSFADAKYGQAMQFDGIDDYVDAGNDSSLNPGAEITMEVWAKIDSYSSSIGAILNKYDGAGKDYYRLHTQYGRFYTTIEDATGTLIIQLRTDSGTILYDVWYHVAFTFDSSGNVVLYINGEEVKNSTVSHQDIGTGGALYIGALHPADGFYNGPIDEVRIYNRALSADEIRAHYLRGTGAHGLVQADEFRVLDTDNTVNFQIDGAGNATFVGPIDVQAGTSIFAGNVNFDSGTLFIDSANNRVGIGTTAPGVSLDVQEDQTDAIIRAIGFKTSGITGGKLLLGRTLGTQSSPSAISGPSNRGDTFCRL
jgi:hypothetical protein